ncbi:MAG: hypothetical protein IMZ46_13155 [Acidobacteria bacterium]|nr:hypothetical protein [Acidobacteriota bacterium]
MKILKHLTTTDTRRKRIEFSPEVLAKGPSTRDLNQDLTPKGLTPLEYCVRFALADEWATFAQAVAARVSKEPTHIWEACLKCGRVSTRRYRDKAGRPCISCNYPAYENGGFMADMSPAEITAYQAAKTKAEAEIRERERRSELYRVNQGRQAEGRKPWTMGELEAHQRADYQRRVAEQTQLAAARAGRGERMARAGVLKSPRADAELVQGPAAAPVPKVHRKGV